MLQLKRRGPFFRRRWDLENTSTGTITRWDYSRRSDAESHLRDVIRWELILIDLKWK